MIEPVAGCYKSLPTVALLGYAADPLYAQNSAMTIVNADSRPAHKGTHRPNGWHKWTLLFLQAFLEVFLLQVLLLSVLGALTGPYRGQPSDSLTSHFAPPIAASSGTLLIGIYNAANKSPWRVHVGHALLQVCLIWDYTELLMQGTSSIIMSHLHCLTSSGSLMSAQVLSSPTLQTLVIMVVVSVTHVSARLVYFHMVHVAEGTEPGGFLFDLWGLVVAGWKRIEQLSKRSQTESRSDETFEMSARNTIGGFRRWLPFKVSNLGICDGFTLFPPEFHALHATDRWQDGRRERSSSRR